MTSTGRKITYATKKYLDHFFYLSRTDYVTATTHTPFVLQRDAREKTWMHSIIPMLRVSYHIYKGAKLKCTSERIQGTATIED